MLLARENYVHPVTGAREPVPESHAVWRFRAVSFVLLALLAWGTLVGVNKLLHFSGQDPANDVPTAPTPSGP